MSKNPNLDRRDLDEEKKIGLVATAVVSGIMLLAIGGGVLFLGNKIHSNIFKPIIQTETVEVPVEVTKEVEVPVEVVKEVEVEVPVPANPEELDTDALRNQLYTYAYALLERDEPINKEDAEEKHNNPDAMAKTFYMFSSDKNGKDMTAKPTDDSKYIGVYEGTTDEEAPTDPSAYTWDEYERYVETEVQK